RRITVFRPIALFVGAVVLFSAPAARAAEQPKEIIEKAIKAHGGAEFLTKHKAAKSRAKGKVDTPGVGEGEFTQETCYMAPDKIKDRYELTIAGQKMTVLTVVNGDDVAVEVNGEALDLSDEEKAPLKEMSYLLKVSRLVSLTDKEFELTALGEDTV